MKKMIRQAVELYESFREQGASRKIKRVTYNVPQVAAVIGYLEFVGYRTTHGKKVTLYKHDFEAGSRPLMCVSPDGKQLLLLGGRYQFTSRGIQDKDARGKLIDDPKHGKDLPGRKDNPAPKRPTDTETVRIVNTVLKRELKAFDLLRAGKIKPADMPERRAAEVDAFRRFYRQIAKPGTPMLSAHDEASESA